MKVRIAPDESVELILLAKIHPHVVRANQAHREWRWGIGQGLSQVEGIWGPKFSYARGSKAGWLSIDPRPRGPKGRDYVPFNPG